MATIVLQAVGSAVGAAVGGPAGAMIGRAVGALAGSYIDQQIFGPEDQAIEGPRLEGAQILNSREGAPIPRVFGRVRVAGQVIWATRLVEEQITETQSQGGKGGGGGGGSQVTTVSYSYFGNFAIGLCEGEIAHFGRIWADGELLDQTQYAIRRFKGGEAQRADSLIETKQGASKAPAYRGLAYLVFEHFPLEAYGNRIPQISVEVIKTVGDLQSKIHAVNMIPGGTEFGYDTVQVIETVDEVESRRLNSHQSVAETDFLASLDELTGLCPNLNQIALVTSWFGDDLRAEQCRITPRVEVRNRNIISGHAWQVGGLKRHEAQLVSYLNGAPAYGGTPDDDSIVRAIQEIKKRGVKVCLNPFVMMDVFPGYTLPDPYGGSRQPSYPWRGRITCHPAPLHPGSPDRSDTARQQVAQFVGAARKEHFSTASGEVLYSGPDEWSYRRMILHYAHLAALAGGVDMFLLGSELPGLTKVRGAGDTFPFVDALRQLASDVASIIGPSCTITYGADWSEYFGHQPDDGSGDVYFHLDPLWAHPSVGAVGIDNYMPISDWRSSGDPDGSGRNSTDPAMLAAHIAGGEGYDWYYASDADREYAQRTPITDALGKPWIYRYKDLKSWWRNRHFERRGGVELSSPTNWLPQSKPIIFTELGCPAVNNGAVQPNVFVDAKSAESALPYFSNGGRNDYMQLAYINAQQQHWLGDGERGGGDENFNNPISDVYSSAIVDFQRTQFWAWDARPYPTFPSAIDLWSDTPNWQNGHWLTGRLGMVRLADLIADLLVSSGVTEFDVSQVDGVAEGYLIGQGGSARQALEVLLQLYRISVFEDAGIVHFVSFGKDPVSVLRKQDLVHNPDMSALSRVRDQEADLPASVQLNHIDPHSDLQETHTSTARIDAHGVRQQNIRAPLVLGRDAAEHLLEAWLHASWTARDSVSFGLSYSFAHLTVGDIVAFSADPLAPTWQITGIETGLHLSINARAVELGEHQSRSASSEVARVSTRYGFGRPLVRFMDLPHLPTLPGSGGNCLAVAAKPWPGEMAIYASPSEEGFSYQQSTSTAGFIGQLELDLDPGSTFARWDHKTRLRIKLHQGSLASQATELVLNGANGLAVQSRPGAYEILQFQTAELVADQTYELSILLRGQSGTENEAIHGAEAGASAIVLNQAVTPLEGDENLRGLETNWLVGPVGKQLDGPEFARSVFTPGYRSLLPFSPVHLMAEKVSIGAEFDISVSWIRRDRINADDWSAIEIPMSEAAESYLLTLTSNLPGQLRKTVATSSSIISKAQLSATFGTVPQELTIAVSQVSAVVGPGPAGLTKLTL